MVITNYTIERQGFGIGDVVIYGTQTQAPTDNEDGGKNYKCMVS